jgi:hypothetical protein
MNNNKYCLPLGRAVWERNIRRQTNKVGKTTGMRGTL